MKNLKGLGTSEELKLITHIIECDDLLVMIVYSFSGELLSIGFGE